MVSAWMEGLRQLKPLVHLLFPLMVDWIADEMTVSVLVDLATYALCPGETNCPEAIYINGIQQTVTGIFKMIVIPLIGQVSDEYGRKPFLLLTLSTNIVPFILLAISQSRGVVYAYYAIRTIAMIISKGTIFRVAVAYVADIVDVDKWAAVFSWMTGLFSVSLVIGNLLARFLPEEYIFQVSIVLLIFVPVYMALFLKETARSTQKRQTYAIPKKSISVSEFKILDFSLMADVCGDTQGINFGRSAGEGLEKRERNRKEFQRDILPFISEIVKPSERSSIHIIHQCSFDEAGDSGTPPYVRMQAIPDGVDHISDSIRHNSIRHNLGVGMALLFDNPSIYLFLPTN